MQYNGRRSQQALLSFSRKKTENKIFNPITEYSPSVQTLYSYCWHCVFISQGRMVFNQFNSQVKWTNNQNWTDESNIFVQDVSKSRVNCVQIILPFKISFPSGIKCFIRLLWFATHLAHSNT